MSKFDAEPLTPAEAEQQFLRFDVPQTLTAPQQNIAQASLGIVSGTGGGAIVGLDTDPDGIEVLLVGGDVPGGGTGGTGYDGGIQF